MSEKKEGNYLNLVIEIQQYAKENHLDVRDVIIACEITKGAIINGMMEGLMK